VKYVLAIVVLLLASCSPLQRSATDVNLVRVFVLDKRYDFYGVSNVTTVPGHVTLRLKNGDVFSFEGHASW
jgi:hypothetical protein